MKIRVRHSGMTLIETMVAATVVLLALLSLLGVIAFGLGGVRNAEGHQQAVLYARRLMELVRERRLAQLTTVPPQIGFADAPSVRDPLDAPPFGPKPKGPDFPAGSSYTRRIVSAPLSTDPSNYQSKVYRIDVTVYWTVKARENRYHLSGFYRAP